MKTRVISGICMIPLLAVVYLGGYWLTAACILVGFIGVREFFNGFRAMGINPSEKIALCAMLVLYLLNGFFPGQHEYLLGWLAASIMASSIYIFKIDERRVEDGMATMLGIIYVIFFSYHVVLVDQTPGVFRADLAGSAVGILYGYFRLFQRIFVRKTQALPCFKPQKDCGGCSGRNTGKCNLLRPVRLVCGFPYLDSLSCHRTDRRSAFTVRGLDGVCL